ncbi:hypothetical protein IQ250_18605 [Pseudanabaenaceae cyanobacterium LEGE 13415]|nr:hypothetical protein [Pseudanabaenaceae cyanobacterium LEGE 13415]
MSTKPFDQFNKRLFETLLSPFGTVTPNRAVLGEERAIDIYFEPNPNVSLPVQELGYLSLMLDKPALLEPFRSSLSDEDMHNCLLKLFLVYAEYRRQEESIKTENLPRLWILCASVSNVLIEEFNGQFDTTFGEGFYSLAPRLRATIVVIDELPTTPETLWLRLLGRGRT